MSKARKWRSRPGCMVVRPGDKVLVKGIGRRIPRGRRLSLEAARKRRCTIWTVVGYITEMHKGIRLLLRTERKRSPMEMVCNLSEITTLDQEGETCTSSRFSEQKPRELACWGVEHPKLGPALAVRAPLSEGFTEDLKRLVKARDRWWDRWLHLWYVRRHLRPITEALLRKHYPSYGSTESEEQPDEQKGETDGETEDQSG